MSCDRANSGSDFRHGLAETERARKWEELEAIERAASKSARLHEGTRELLELLRCRGIATALVTNNTEENTRRLLSRFGLHFDVVLTRDSGFWKPSGEPVAEAARRLGVPAETCLGVGDSRYDLQAARDAGLGAACLLHDGASRCDEKPDLSFPDIPALIQYLRTASADSTPEAPPTRP